ncbi:hypothetical protein Zmor_008900 [Zophobas morio]|uniref:Uncharacterized protein n=1 Tax=Zophobas morio TaxID=2755281 RepID=A0AA38LZF9_9CUCU|nr:hypothetical protein Zmor_008900 [Zophobas morio]
MTYASTAWAYNSLAMVCSLQVRQNQLLHLMMGAPWLVYKDTLHEDHQIEPLGNVFRRNSIATYEWLNQHTNRLLADETNYDILVDARYRQPRNGI